MLRLLLLIGLMSVGLTLIPSDVRAQGGAWDACRGRVGPSGPELEDCRPLAGVVDPQGREMWLRRTIDAPADPMPQALYIVGVASSEVWLNGRPLGRNGMPGADGPSEAPGMYQAVLPIRDGLWRPTGNDLVVHLSSFHGGLRLRYPVGTIDVAPYPYPRAEWLIGAKLFAAGALFAATFGFGVIHGIRRTSSSLTLACMAAAAGLHALLESLNLLVAYPYPLHVWRLVGIWALAVAFAILLVDFVAIRVWPSARRRVVPAASALIFGSILVQGYDGKTAWALGIGLAVAAALAAVGAWRRTPGAAVAFGYLVLFLAVAVMQPAWFTDLSYFLLAALLVLPLLMIEVVRLGVEGDRRETALARAAAVAPDLLIVPCTRGVERVRLADVVAVVGADDYAELRLRDGRRLLHAARLDRLEADLAPGFVRTHRSVLINLEHLTALERVEGRHRVIMSEGQPLPVSRKRLASVRRALDDGMVVAA